MSNDFCNELSKSVHDHSNLNTDFTSEWDYLDPWVIRVAWKKSPLYFLLQVKV